jgi:hypothetical protein
MCSWYVGQVEVHADWPARSIGARHPVLLRIKAMYGSFGLGLVIVKAA